MNEEVFVMSDKNLPNENNVVALSLQQYENAEALLHIQTELLDREERDLSVLPPHEQYRIIMDKVGLSDNSLIPKALSTPEQLMEKFNHDELTDLDIAEIIMKNELYGKLLRSKQTDTPLSVKVGVDPTAGQIHLGHGITLRMMRRFQQMGHNIQFVIGDATARVGDATGRLNSRTTLTVQEVTENMKSYIAQASRIIDLSPDNPNVETHNNSEWLGMGMLDWLPILLQLSASRAMDRKDFVERLERGGSISLGELMYAAFMAYDSLHLKSQIEIGGRDQYLNFLQTRGLMAKNGLEPETIVTVDLLPGTTGTSDEQGRLVKMSKSLNNSIALDEPPLSLYTKVMGIPDSLMVVWLRELTEISSAELETLMNNVASPVINPDTYQSATIDPIEVKRMLARIVIASLNNKDMVVVKRAEDGSKALVGKDSKLRPESATVLQLDHEITLFGVLQEIDDPRLKTGGRIRRLVANNGVKILIKDPSNGLEHYAVVDTSRLLNENVTDNTYFKVGKNSVFRVRIPDPN